MSLIGATAGLLTTICWLPQVLRSWRTRSTADLSWTYLAVLTLGVWMWIVYGAVTADMPILLSNTTTAAAVAVLTVLKISQRRDSEGTSDAPA